MHELPLLINITVALVVAFIGGFLARRAGLPAIVGYLLAGIAIGPFTPGYVGDVDTIQQLAELGVIFLMFGVGLHFSLSDLWKVRDIAIPGALLQTAVATLLGIGLTRLWGWTPVSGIVLGLSISVASTVVLLRGLMDNSLLNTTHGQAAIGWLVMEDILSVLIIVLMPALSSASGGFDWESLVITLLKAAAFVVIMFFGGVRLIPWLLDRIAHTRSRELFILAILAIVLGIALGAAGLFGVSLALGAFVAGAIISQSHLSHQVGADIESFRETFSVLFFVSVGMLVNPLFLWENLGRVVTLTLLIIVGKSVIVLLLGLAFPRPARTFLIVAIGLSQIGEFSFILGSTGVKLNLLAADQYSLILAGALISITLNPFMYRLLPNLEKWLQKTVWFWKQLDHFRDLQIPTEEQLKDHVVIIGYGRVGKLLVDVLGSLRIPRLVIESDVERIEELNKQSILTLYGDPANSEVISHAGLKNARALVVTVPTESTAIMVVATAKDIHPELPIIVRAASNEGMQNLSKLGARYIVHPEFEGGLEMAHQMLLKLGFPLREVHEFTDAIRRDKYDFSISSDEEHRTLHDLLMASGMIEVHWLYLDETSRVVGQSLLEANIRSKTGASVVAIFRDNQLTANPKSMTVFESGDRVGLIGETSQIQSARELMNGLEADQPRLDV